MYSLDYYTEATAYNGVEEDAPLIVNAKVYTLGEKYQIEALRDMAKKKFEESLERDVLHESFLVAIGIIYSNTPLSHRGIRDLIVDEVNYQKSHMKLQPKFLQLIREHGDFAVDIT